MTAYGARLFDQHAKMLEASTITPDHARRRGYVSVDTKIRLEQIGIAKAGQSVPGLLIPLLGIDGRPWGHQYRPDAPRINSAGKPIKYENPVRQSNRLDIPPGVPDQLGDPSVPLWITEGARKADAGAIAGLCIVAVLGVNNWRGTNGAGGKVALPDFHDVALNGRQVILAFDNDVMTKPEVRKALRQFGAWLKIKEAKVAYCLLPQDAGKIGLDDYLAGHTVEELWALVQPEPPEILDDKSRPDPQAPPRPATPAPKPRTLPETLDAFRRWLHLEDTAPVLATAAAIVANRAAGDPVWLLVVGPPSGGKTEIISSASSLPYIVKAATVTEAALLSGTANRERAANATGGLLRMVSDFGILLCKDFTSVLSQNRDTAKAAMAALREVYDGSWDRPVGTDGGRVLSWSGKCGLVGGVTPSLDRYSAITNALGDRFLLLRLPDVAAAEQAASALRRRDHDNQMRSELAAAMTGLIHAANLEFVGRDLHEHEHDRLVALATYTARARTAVERDGYSHELVVIPQAEGPARLVLALRHLYGGLEAIGADEPTRWAVTARVARDCVPAIRNKLIADLVGRTDPARTSDVAAAVGMVTKTAHQHLEDLALLGLADRAKTSDAGNAPDLWSASDWLRRFWPDAESEREMYVRTGSGFKEEVGDDTDKAPTDTPVRTSRSHFGEPSSTDGKRACSTDWATCAISNCSVFHACVQSVDTGAPTGRTLTDEAVA
jgi:hypothetical protein